MFALMDQQPLDQAAQRMSMFTVHTASSWKNWWKGEKNLKKFYITFEESVLKICRISKLVSRRVESKNFWIIKFKPIRNHRDQYFENNFRKIIKFYKKIEKQLQK